jgi:hypothetical protein
VSVPALSWKQAHPCSAGLLGASPLELERKDSWVHHQDVLALLGSWGLVILVLAGQGTCPFAWSLAYFLPTWLTMRGETEVSERGVFS